VGVGVERQKKIRLAVLFGGRSGEHEVSLMSAASLIQAADKSKYEIIPIGIDKNGRWLIGGEAMALLSRGEMTLDLPQSATASTSGAMMLLDPIQDGTLRLADQTIDVVFPALHGTYGEDGSVQGLLELVNVPLRGSGRSRFSGGHGQGSHESVVPRCGAANSRLCGDEA
jgi:D-alanine-D-alanine ligase